MRNDGVTVVVKKVVIALITALYDMLWDGRRLRLACHIKCGVLCYASE